MLHTFLSIQVVVTMKAISHAHLTKEIKGGERMAFQDDKGP